MSHRKNVPTFAVPTDAYTAFGAQAKIEGKSFSQAVRDAMSEYLASRGVQADFNAGTWGGYRSRDDDESLPPPMRGADIVDLAKQLDFNHDDVNAMMEAINEGCGKVDESGW